MKKLLALLLSVLLTLTMFGCSRTDKDVSNVVSLVNQGQVNDAIKIYKNKIAPDNKKLEKTREEFKKMIKETMEKYENQECEYQTAFKKLMNIDQFGCVYAESQAALERLTVLNGSDTAYSEGLNYFNNKDYLNAIKILSCVDNISSHYSDAQNKIFQAEINYKNEVITEADKLISSEDFEGAIKNLKEALSVYSEDSALKASLNTAITEYTSTVKDKAKNLYDNKQYKEAVDCLNKFLSSFQSDEISKLKDEYLLKLPKSLFECFVVDYSHCAYLSSDVTDSWGNTYDNHMHFYGTTIGYVIYNVECNYNCLKGIIAPNSRSRTNYVFKVKIYADDNLVYDSGDIVKTAKSISFDITELNNASSIKIDYESSSIYDVDEYNTGILADFILYNN